VTLNTKTSKQKRVITLASVSNVAALVSYLRAMFRSHQTLRVPSVSHSSVASKRVSEEALKKKSKQTCCFRTNFVKKSSARLSPSLPGSERFRNFAPANQSTFFDISCTSRYRIVCESGSIRTTESSEDNIHSYLEQGLGSVVLISATVVALFLANSANFSPLYKAALHKTIGPSALNLSMSLHHWVNEGLMALFFFTVGLEIKREFVHGSLSSLRKALLPCIGAVGGMIVPMLVYVFHNLNSPAGVLAGWAIPMATDIAFAMGVYGFFKSKMPSGVAAFLLTLATVDDLGAIIVIAVCFAKELAFNYVIGALLTTFALVAACKRKMKNVSFFMCLFATLWYCLLQGGINADIAGVITALCIPGAALAPSTSMAPPEHEGAKVTLLDHLIHAWTPWTSLIVMPLFALANTGVLVDKSVLGSVAVSPVGQGIFYGLIFGKPLGIAGLSWLSVRCGVANFPKGMNMLHLGVVGILGGIGFTMSLFLIEISLAAVPWVARTAKMAILSSSLISALLAAFLMSRLPKSPSESTIQSSCAS
jgi:NhaA family Na+:H+ antiporter